METFTKYSTLPWMLRSHALLYASLNSLRHYSQCSKQCNEEFGKQHIDKPEALNIGEDVDKMEVKLVYRQQGSSSFGLKFLKMDEDSHFLQLNDSAETTICRGNYKQSAVDYVKNRLKYNWNGNISGIFSRGNFWPFDAQDMRRIRADEFLNICFDEQVFQEFYESIEDVELENVHLQVMNNRPLEFNIPAEFFKTPFFQNLEQLMCLPPLPSLDALDFMTMKASSICINCSSLSDEVINQKLCQYFSNPLNDIPPSYFFFKFNPFDRETLLQNLHILHTDFEENTEFITVKHASGDESTMNCLSDDIEPRYQINFQ